MADETTPGDKEVGAATPAVDASADSDETASDVEDYDAEAADETASAGDETGDEAVADGDETAAAPAKPPMSHVKLATIAGLVLVVVLGGLTGWLGYRAYESRKADDLQNLFLQVGRQGALNLTTISHEHAEQDVQRVLDSSTGTFYDDFQARSQPFVEVVKQAQSKSEGTVAEAGIEESSDTEARVLVAVTVNTTNAGAPEQQPRAWRMRITVQKTGEDEAKISNVEFVP